MKSQIPLIGRKLYEKNLLAGWEGNLSEKRGDHILITASGLSKSSIQEKDLLWVDLKGQSFSQKKKQRKNLKSSRHDKPAPKPSSELEMHLAVYKAQKKAKALIHAHPPSAIALSLAKPQWKYLPPVLPEMIVLMGRVPIAPYICPGTKELGEGLKSFVKKHQALILSHHGAIVWAENLNKAFMLMEQLEQCCKILILAEALGGAKKLPKKELEKLAQKSC